jgi:hypothetical protein
VKLNPNYACTKCGRTFSTKYSGKRHITNVERGIAALLPYAAYNAGLKARIYSPPIPRPTYGKSLPEILYDEFMRELARQAAIKHFQDPAMQNLIFSMIRDGGRRINRKESELERHDEQFNAELNDILSRIDNKADPASSNTRAASSQYKPFWFSE